VLVGDYYCKENGLDLIQAIFFTVITNHQRLSVDLHLGILLACFAAESISEQYLLG